MRINLTATTLLLTAALSAQAAVVYEENFEKPGKFHTADDFYTGKQSYLFAGNGKYAYRKFPLNLKPSTRYRLTLAIKKDVCPMSVARKMDFNICGYLNKKYITYIQGGASVFGEGKWNTFSKEFTTPAQIGPSGLMFYNRTSVDMFIDAIKVEEISNAPAAIAAKSATAAPAAIAAKSATAAPAAKSATAAPAAPAAAAETSVPVNRPVPPINAETLAKEDWLTNRRGIEALDPDFILPPFSPIVFKDNTASVWGRDYRFSKNGLLDNVAILGKNFLASAMEYSAVVNGKKVNFTPEGQMLLRRRKGIVELLSRASSPDLDLEIRTAIEYDGMVKIDFTLIPRSSVEVNDFRYKINIPEKDAKFIHYTGAREGGWSLNVPRISNTRLLPAGSGKVWSAPFKLLVWLGTYDRGFLWFCGSEQHWAPMARKQRQDAISVSRRNGTASLEINPISENYLIGRPTTYTFGLMATPVRPRPEGWRALDMNYEYFAATAEKKYKADTPVIYSSGSYDYVPPTTRNPAAVGFYPRLYNLDAYRARIKKAHDKGRLFGLYIDPILMNVGIYKDMAQYKNKLWDPTNDNAETGAAANLKTDYLWQPPEVIKYFAEWRKEPVSTAPYGRSLGERQFQTGLGSRYADFFCYLMEVHAKNGCDGIANLDEWGPVPDQNLRHDMGYLGRDGKVYPEYDWFGRRNLIKRICAVFLKERGKMPLMRIHLAATLVAPIASFGDSVITGENINSAYFNGASLLDKYTVNRQEILNSLKNGGRDFLYYASTPERWAIEYGGQAFGWAVCVMSNATKSPKFDSKYASSNEATRDYLAMCLAHDNLLWPVFCKPDEAYKVMRIKQQFGIADKAVKFYPYWGDEHPAKSSGKEVYTVTYRNGKRSMVIVCNLSLQKQDVTVTLDKKFFGSKCQVTDAETNLPVTLSGSKFNTSVKRRNFRIFWINN